MLTFFDFRENIITKSKGTKIIVDLVFEKRLPTFAWCKHHGRGVIQLGVLHRHYFPSPGQLGSYLPRQTLYQHGLLENTLPVITSRWIIKNNNSPAICFHHSLHGTVGRTLCHWSLWSIARNSLIDIFFDRFPGQLGSHSFEQTHCKQCQWSMGSIIHIRNKKFAW